MYFTICVPVYNRQDTIIRTLASIQRQAFFSYEVLIVDDGSTDHTAELVKEFIEAEDLCRQFYLIHKENGGKHSALNVGIKKAQGEFFIILDSDDWLTDTALSELYEVCRTIQEDDSFCGVMGKTRNFDSGEMIGDPFDLSNPVSSYFEYHFILPQTLYVQDCFEATKTRLLKQFRFPEQEGMKFVPEAWLFDQLGVAYHLLLTNTIFRETQYLDDGMTKNSNFKKDHVDGFLYHYISRIENVISRKKMPLKLKIRLLTLSWWRYWQCVKIDRNHRGPRIGHVTAFGWLVRLAAPSIDFVFKKKYPSYRD